MTDFRRLLFLIILLLHVDLFFARAGGGRGGGGGGGFGGGHSIGGSYRGFYLGYKGERPLTAEDKKMIVIGLLVGPGLLLVYVAFITYLYFRKGPRNKKIIGRLRKHDEFWNYEKIIGYSKGFYLEVQKHWSSNSLKDIEHKLTPSLFRQQQSILNKYKKKRLVNMVEAIVIEKAYVIYFDDYLDNDKDIVAVMIEGQMKDYFRSPVMNSETAETEKFKDAFVFLRRGEEMILSEIINEPDRYDVATIKNTLE
jgi:hypothetical protein